MQPVTAISNATGSSYNRVGGILTFLRPHCRPATIAHFWRPHCRPATIARRQLHSLWECVSPHRSTTATKGPRAACSGVVTAFSTCFQVLLSVKNVEETFLTLSDPCFQGSSRTNAPSIVTAFSTCIPNCTFRAPTWPPGENCTFFAPTLMQPVAAISNATGYSYKQCNRLQL